MTVGAARRGFLLAVAMVGAVSACTAIPPTKTENPLSVPGSRTDIVSVCYDSKDHTRGDIEAVALANCRDKAVAVTAWQVDRVFNECPLLKKSRVSFICVTPRRGY